MLASKLVLIRTMNLCVPWTYTDYVIILQVKLDAIMSQIQIETTALKWSFWFSFDRILDNDGNSKMIWYNMIISIIIAVKIW